MMMIKLWEGILSGGVEGGCPDEKYKNEAQPFLSLWERARRERLREDSPLFGLPLMKTSFRLS